MKNIKTIGGMSVRRELELRLTVARTSAIQEVISFLKASGHRVAAVDLRIAAFGEPTTEEPLTE